MLILCLAFTVVSCGKDEDDNNEPEVNNLDAFNEAVAATNPDGVIIDIKTTSELGELVSKYIVTYNDDGTAVVDQTVERFSEFDPENPENYVKKTTEKSVVRMNADGTFTGTVSGTAANIVAGVAINLSSVASAVQVNESGDVLTVTVPAASTEAVLGMAVSADVTLVISISGGAVEQIKMTYTGAEIVCKYN